MVPKEPFVLLGGTGYIASWLIMKLLEHGYSVNATTRSNSASGIPIIYLFIFVSASVSVHKHNFLIATVYIFFPMNYCVY